jgi:microcystin-dependent protein
MSSYYDWFSSSGGTSGGSNDFYNWFQGDQQQNPDPTPPSGDGGGGGGVTYIAPTITSPQPLQLVDNAYSSPISIEYQFTADKGSPNTDNVVWSVTPTTYGNINSSTGYLLLTFPQGTTATGDFRVYAQNSNGLTYQAWQYVIVSIQGGTSGSYWALENGIYNTNATGVRVRTKLDVCGNIVCKDISANHISAKDVSANNLVYSVNGMRGDVSLNGIGIPNVVNSFNTRTGFVTLTATDISNALTYVPLNAATYTPLDVLNKLKTVDGSGCGLDADLLDGLNSTYYLNYNNLDNKPWVYSGDNSSNIIYNGGNVGIGTTNPAYQFQISSDEHVINQNVEIYTNVELPPPKLQYWSFANNQYYREISNESCRLGDYGSGTYYTWASDNSDTSKLFTYKLVSPNTRLDANQQVQHYRSIKQWAQNVEHNDFYIVLSSPNAIVPTGFNIVPTHEAWNSPFKFTLQAFTQQYQRSNMPGLESSTTLFTATNEILVTQTQYWEYTFTASVGDEIYVPQGSAKQFGAYQPAYYAISTNTAYRTFVLKVTKLFSYEQRIYEGGAGASAYWDPPASYDLVLNTMRIFGKHPTASSISSTQIKGTWDFKTAATEWGLAAKSIIQYISGFIGMPSNGLVHYVNRGIYDTPNYAFGNATAYSGSKDVYPSINGDNTIQLNKGAALLLGNLSQQLSGNGLTMFTSFTITEAGNKGDIVYYYGSTYNKTGNENSADNDRPFFSRTTADSLHLSLYGSSGHDHTPPYPFEISLRHESSSALKLIVDFKDKFLKNNAAQTYHEAGVQVSWFDYPEQYNLGRTIQIGFKNEVILPYSLNTQYVLTIVLNDKDKLLTVYYDTISNVLQPAIASNYKYNEPLTSTITFNNNGLNKPGYFTDSTNWIGIRGYDDYTKTRNWKVACHYYYNRPVTTEELLMIWTYCKFECWANPTLGSQALGTKSIATIKKLPMIEDLFTNPKLTFNGNINNLSFGTSSIIPTVNNIVSLGNADLRFKDVYVGANSIDIEGTKLSGSNGKLGIGVADPSYNLHVNEMYATTYYNLPDVSANVILEKLKTVDGSGCGLDADLLDGQDGTYYRNWNNLTNKPNLVNTFNGRYGDVSLNITDISGFILQSNWNQTNVNSQDYIKNKPPFFVSGDNIGIGTTPAYTLDISGNFKANRIYGVLYSDISGTPTSFGSGDTIPIGTISPYYSTTLTDSSWLVCDGSTYQRSQYIELANVLGVSPSATTFQVPDLRDKFLKGKNADAVGSTGGSASTTLTTANLPDHTHTGTTGAGGAHTHTLKTNTGEVFGGYYEGNSSTGTLYKVAYSSYPSGTGRSDVNSVADHTHTFTTSGTTGATATAFTNQPPYTTIIYIIKAKNNQYQPLNNTNWSSSNSNVFYQSGNVGIATNSPQYNLDVNGSINLTGDLYKNGVIQTIGYDGGIVNNQIIIKNNNGLRLDYLQGLSTSANGNLIFDLSGFTFQSKPNAGSTYTRASVNMASLDCSGNINFTGNIYQNGSLFTGSFNGGTVANTISVGNANNGYSSMYVPVLNAGGYYTYMSVGGGTGGYCYWFKNDANRTGDGGTRTATLRNDDGNLRLQSSGAYGIEIKGGTGAVNIHNGSPYSVPNNYMASGSLTIGGTNVNYGGGTNYWNSSTAGLMMECADNTEIAVHDAGARVASFMYYSGNNFYIGRNMGWGRAGVVPYFANNIWHQCTNGNNRFHFAPNSTTYFGSANGYEWRNSGDGWCMSLGNDGTLYTNYISVSNRIATSGIYVNGSYYMSMNAYVSSTNAGGLFPNVSIYNTYITSYLNGNCYVSGQLYVSSDERIKKNITSVDKQEAINIIQAIQPKKYQWIDPMKSQHEYSYGVIAQETIDVFPEACMKTTDFLPNINEVAQDVSFNETTTSFKITKTVSVGETIRLHVADASFNPANIDLNQNTIDDAQEKIMVCKVIDVSDDVITVDKSTNSNHFFVYGTQTNDIHLIDYTTFVPLLISTCQSLLTKNQALEDRLAALEEKLNLHINNNNATQN